MQDDKGATELGLITVLITNGFRLEDKYFVDELQSYSLNGVNFSMKAGDPLLHAELTRTKISTFNTVLNGIRNLANSNIRFEVTTIANTCVLDHMDKICQIAIDNGAKKFSIDFCSVSFKDSKPSSAYMPDPAEVINAIVSQYPAMDRAASGGFHLAQSLPTCLWPAEFLAQLEAKNQIEYGCHVMTREGLVFDHSGQLLICNHLHDFPLGQIGVNFTDAASFTQFWQSSEISEYYDQINTYPAQRCINCQTYTKCGGGCPLLWFVYNPENITREEETK
ncbi:MAG: SPASM domain-containing protein [Nitrospirae bacterium]|nr:SPASM domain-containing protein [Nitrospirota bacterium]